MKQLGNVADTHTHTHTHTHTRTHTHKASTKNSLLFKSQYWHHPLYKTRVGAGNCR